MIHLDTNYLIGLAVAGSPQALRVGQWLAAGESLAVSAVVWTEFLNGPVQPQEILLVESIIESRVMPFDKATAVWRPGFSIKPDVGAVRASIV